MKHLQTAVLLALAILLPVSACVKSHYLSLEARRKTEETSNYRIVRKLVGALGDSKTYSASVWLELQNHTPWKTRVTIDCRFYRRTPNQPVANAVRTLVLQPWEVRTEPFTATSLWLKGIQAWCGMIDSDFVDTKK